MIENLSIFDIIAVSLILILGIKGIMNGFIKELLGLIGVVGGIFVASRFANEAGALITKHIYKLDTGATLYLAGFVSVLVLFWLSSIILGHILESMLKMSGLGLLNKIAGFAVGSAKIFLVFSILAVTLSNIEFIKNKTQTYMAGSFMYPIFVETGTFIVKYDTNKITESITIPSQTPQN